MYECSYTMHTKAKKLQTTRSKVKKFEPNRTKPGTKQKIKPIQPSGNLFRLNIIKFELLLFFSYIGNLSRLLYRILA